MKLIDSEIIPKDKIPAGSNDNQTVENDEAEEYDYPCYR